MSKDPYEIFNSYIIARKHTARVLCEKLKSKYGLVLDQKFFEEIIELMAQTAIEYMKLYNQVYTVTVQKEEIDDETEQREGNNDDQEPSIH